MTDSSDFNVTMPPEDKAAWLKALRSGDYTQGRQYLCVNGKFCCLGVLAHIKEVPSKTNPRYHDGVETFDFGDGKLCRSILPNGFLGLDTEFQTVLADENDNGMSFAEIADFIEETVKC